MNGRQAASADGCMTPQRLLSAIHALGFAVIMRKMSNKSLSLPIPALRRSN